MAVEFIREQLEGLKKSYRDEGLGAIIGKYSDIFLVGVIMTLIGMMIVPLPHFLLDLLLTVNIAFAVVLLLISLYISEPIPN